MVIFPGSKINIGLNITAKRVDGYHDLESLFFPIPLSDILEINKSDRFSIDLSGISIHGDPSDNLIVKAYHLMVAHYQIGAVKIHLHKIVPMGAGLGGGSADGAATLVLLNKLFNLNLSDTKLEEHAQTLGSDCPFFIQNKPAYVKGTGNLMERQKVNLENYWIQIVNPGIHISTQTAFSKIAPKNPLVDLRAVIAEPIDTWKDKVRNDFEPGIFDEFDEVRRVKETLYANGALYASMTGTGSSVYGLFKEEPNSIRTSALFSDFFEWTSILK